VLPTLEETDGSIFAKFRPKNETIADPVVDKKSGANEVILGESYDTKLERVAVRTDMETVTASEGPRPEGMCDTREVSDVHAVEDDDVPPIRMREVTSCTEKHDPNTDIRDMPVDGKFEIRDEHTAGDKNEKWEEDIDACETTDTCKANESPTPGGTRQKSEVSEIHTVDKDDVPPTLTNAEKSKSPKLEPDRVMDEGREQNKFEEDDEDTLGAR
jgi:hypothetical protein